MYAWINKKRRRTQISEDEFTSCVFGPLRIMKPKQAWNACLVLFGDALEDRFSRTEPSRVDIKFWPKFPRNDGRRFVEPDVHIVAWVDDNVVATILIEVKREADLGREQLVNQWKYIYVDSQRQTFLRECSYHVLLSNRSIKYTEQIESQKKEKEIEWGERGERLIELSWYDVALNLKRNEDRLKELWAWQEDLLNFLASQGIIVFGGFQCLQLDYAGSIEWQFDGSRVFTRPVLQIIGPLHWSFQEEGATA